MHKEKNKTKSFEGEKWIVWKIVSFTICIVSLDNTFFERKKRNFVEKKQLQKKRGGIYGKFREISLIEKRRFFL